MRSTRFASSRPLLLLSLVASTTALSVGCVASSDTTSLGETASAEAVGRTTQADPVGLPAAAADLGAVVQTLAPADADVGAMIIAYGISQENDPTAIADYSDDPTADSKARFGTAFTAYGKMQTELTNLNAQLTQFDTVVANEVGTLPGFDIHQTMTQLDSCSRILVNNGVPLGQGLTDAARAQLQTGVDLLEPQISDTIEYAIHHFPANTDKNVYRIAYLTWATAVRLRVAYGSAGIPLDREWVRARRSFMGAFDFDGTSNTPVSGVPGYAGWLAFEHALEMVRVAILDEYKPIRGVADFTGDGYADFVVHDASTGKVKIWPVGSDYKVGIAATSPTSAAGGGYTIGTVDATQWRLRGVGDLNGDGSPDLLWETSDELQQVVWYMNRIAVAQQTVVSNGVRWPVGVGRAPGSNLSNMVGANPNYTAWTPVLGSGEVYSYAPELDWYPRGVADFNSDGFGDLVWLQRSTGKVNIALVAPTVVPVSPLSIPQTVQAASWNGGGTWDIRGVGDFNDDGHPDLLWEEDSTKRIGVWLMNGTNAIGEQDLAFRPLKKASTVVFHPH